jgi:hypothetical protein
MKAPKQILEIWKRFNAFPMETVTKAWIYAEERRGRQRTVAEMKEHWQRYNIAGNCFDLALWFLEECRQAGIDAFPVGSCFHTPHAHVAVVAKDENGYAYLCDLGDQWIQPVLIDPESDEYSEEILTGFFPGAKIKVQANSDSVKVTYFRRNGKESSQLYSLHRVSDKELLQAAQYSQNIIKEAPLIEIRVPFEHETARWEFWKWRSFISTNSQGLIHEEPLQSLEEWAERIHERTRMDREVLYQALSYYKNNGETVRR